MRFSHIDFPMHQKLYTSILPESLRRRAFTDYLHKQLSTESPQFMQMPVCRGETFLPLVPPLQKCYGPVYNSADTVEFIGNISTKDKRRIYASRTA
jgi:hypothetical protein